MFSRISLIIRWRHFWDGKAFQADKMLKLRTFCPLLFLGSMLHWFAVSFYFPFSGSSAVFICTFPCSDYLCIVKLKTRHVFCQWARNCQSSTIRFDTMIANHAENSTPRVGFFSPNSDFSRFLDLAEYLCNCCGSISASLRAALLENKQQQSHIMWYFYRDEESL